jgi:hypothetical protein
MAESTSRRAALPLELDRIQSSRSAVGETRLRLSGRWLGSDRERPDEEGLLVVHVEGRRHRFAPDRDCGPDPDADPGRWSASFTVPSWAEPRQDGQAALWLGSAVIPVPPLHGTVAGGRADEDGLASRVDTPEPPPPPPAAAPPPPPAAAPPRPPAAASPPPPAAAPPTVAPAPVASAPAEPTDAPRAGPLAELLVKDTIAALHAELEQRTAEAARLRGALAAAHSELDARSVRQSQLEAVLDELRGELERLGAGVASQRRELDRQSAEAASLRERLAAAEAAAELRTSETVALRTELAAANVSREAATGEAAGLRAELERVGSELAITHERVETESGDLGEASRLLADAKALTAELGGERPR